MLNGCGDEKTIFAVVIGFTFTGGLIVVVGSCVDEKNIGFSVGSVGLIKRVVCGIDVVFRWIGPVTKFSSPRIKL